MIEQYYEILENIYLLANIKNFELKCIFICFKNSSDTQIISNK